MRNAHQQLRKIHRSCRSRFVQNDPCPYCQKNRLAKFLRDDERAAYELAEGEGEYIDRVIEAVYARENLN